MKIDICDWLREYLKNGPVEVTEVKRAATQAGYKRAELREAKCICRVVVTNNWTHDHPFTDRWYWGLPEDEV